MCNCYANTNREISAAFAAGASDEVFDAIAVKVQALNVLHTDAAGYFTGC